VEQSDALTLGTLAHFSHFTLSRFGDKQSLSGPNQCPVLGTGILYYNSKME